MNFSAVPKESDFKTDDGVVQIVAIGLLYLSVCRNKDLPDDELVRRVNDMFPCGTTAGWCLPSAEFIARHPSSAPVGCEDDESREHVILVC